LGLFGARGANKIESDFRFEAKPRGKNLEIVLVLRASETFHEPMYYTELNITEVPLRMFQMVYQVVIRHKTCTVSCLTFGRTLLILLFIHIHSL